MSILGIKRTINIIMFKITHPQTCKYLVLGCCVTPGRKVEWVPS